MSNLPAEANPTKTTIAELRDLRDASTDPGLKRALRWAVKRIENSEVDEMKRLEVKTLKYDYFAKLAKTFATSQMVDSDLGEADLFFIIEMGDSVGLSAPQAIQSIASINGKPALWGDGMMAVVRNSSECEYIREEQTGSIDGDDAVAVCITKRRGEPDEVARTFSLEDAKKAGLYPPTGNSVGKSPWAKYPMRMLQMRARAWCLRDVYADVLRGFSSAEEMSDVIDADYSPTPESNVEVDITPKTQETTDTIEQSIVLESGDLDHWLKQIDEAENMATLLTTRDEIKKYDFSEEDQTTLNDRYRLARRALKDAEGGDE